MNYELRIKNDRSAGKRMIQKTGRPLRIACRRDFPAFCENQKICGDGRRLLRRCVIRHTVCYRFARGDGYKNITKSYTNNIRAFCVFYAFSLILRRDA